MTTVYLIRHGSTELNGDSVTSQDKIRGWSDVPLDDKGRQEADATGKKLRDKGIEHFYCSDLKRAVETADIISRYIGMKPRPMRELRPWDLGQFTGKSTKESLPKIAEYAEDKPNEPVPQGESFDSFRERAFKGLNTILRNHPDHVVGMVTHHRYERLLKAWIAEGKPTNLDIDLKTFLAKGEPPGASEAIELQGRRGSVMRNTIKDSIKELAK